MPFSNTAAAAYGLMAMDAMDMYRDHSGSLTPDPAPRLGAAGWTLLAYIAGTDTLLPRGIPVPLQQAVQRVCYGYVAKNAADEVVVAIRGTDGFVEWVEDGVFVPIPYAPALPLPADQPAATVEAGFWGIYGSMTLIDPAGNALGALAPAVAALAAAAPAVTVVGHSLGAALATYFALDLARSALGGRVTACLFASPRPGDLAFASLFDSTVGEYRLFNYVLDIVPRVPAGLGYAPLPRRTVIQPETAEAMIRFDIGCNHHVICYCAMLDYDGTVAATTPMPAAEAGSATCILGPETGAPSIAKEIIGQLAGVLPA